jgi:hypothetical protein
MKNSFEQTFSGSSGETLILKNLDSDPTMWIVDIFKKSFLGKKKSGSFWFSHKIDAEEFVSKYLKR